MTMRILALLVAMGIVAASTTVHANPIITGDVRPYLTLDLYTGDIGAATITIPLAEAKPDGSMDVTELGNQAYYYQNRMTDMPMFSGQQDLTERHAIWAGELNGELAELRAGYVVVWTVVPEPASILMLAVGLCAFARGRRTTAVHEC